jgi:hypothetical protein
MSLNAFRVRFNSRECRYQPQPATLAGAQIAATRGKSQRRKPALRSEVVKIYNGGEYWLYGQEVPPMCARVWHEEAGGFLRRWIYDNFTYPRYFLMSRSFRVSMKMGQP